MRLIKFLSLGGSVLLVALSVNAISIDEVTVFTYINLFLAGFNFGAFIYVGILEKHWSNEF